MKKQISIWISGAAVILLCGCIKEQAAQTPSVAQDDQTCWYATLEATRGTDAQTKSLSRIADGEGRSGWEGGEEISRASLLGETKALSDYNGRLSFTWQYGDKVYVSPSYNWNIPFGELTVQAGGSNQADLRGYLTESYYYYYSVGAELVLTFPKPFEQWKYGKQKGTLEDVSANFDYAIAWTEVTAVDSENRALTLKATTFYNDASINCFSFSYLNCDNNKITRLTISSNNLFGEGPLGNTTVTVIPDTPATTFYVALRPRAEAEESVYEFTAQTENGEVYHGYKKAALKIGKAYKVGYFPLTRYDDLSTPLTLQAMSDGSVTIHNPRGQQILWSVNNPGSFANLSTDSSINIRLWAGDRLSLGGMSAVYGDTTFNDYDLEKSARISCNTPFYLYGNVMSLVNAYHYHQEEYYGTAAARAFAHLFSGNEYLYSHPAKKITLPATKVGRGAYMYMFDNCRNLTHAPALPATTLDSDQPYGLADGCYESMFVGCTSLVSPPASLPAQTLTSRCYNSMFSSCTSMKAAPELPAIQLKDACYALMFDGCSSLQQITCLAKDWGEAWNPTAEWVKGVASSGVFVKNPDASWPVGVSGIPAGWSSDATPLTIEAIEDGVITIDNPQGLTLICGKSASMASAVTRSDQTINIPLSAGEKLCLWGDNDAYGHASAEYLNTHISGSAPHYVYGDIRSLVSSSNYPREKTLKPYAFKQLFMGDTQLKSHPSKALLLQAEVLGAGCYSGLFKGCSLLQTAPALPAVNLAERCYDQMFYGCTSLQSAPALPAMNLALGCYGGMFSMCTSLGTAPSLPAASLENLCYSGMFEGCSSLQTAPVLAAAALKPQCYAYMFRDCSNLNAVTCLAADVSGVDNIESDNYMALTGWLSGVGSPGTFTRKTGVSWPRGENGIPSGWNVVEQ